MPKYIVTNVYRKEIIHVVEAESELEAKDKACVELSKMNVDEIMAEGLEYCDTHVEVDNE